jgi:hypothetical protein
VKLFSSSEVGRGKGGGQRVLNDLERTRHSCGHMNWIPSTPFPPLFAKIILNERIKNQIDFIPSLYAVYQNLE